MIINKLRVPGNKAT